MKKLYVLSIVTTMFVLIAGFAYAAFVDKSNLLGSSFSVGSADLKLLKDVAGDLSSANLSDDLAGPSFSGIGPNWSEDYLVKLYNNASTSIELTSSASYLTANDPENLRQSIYIEPLVWDDSNGNGLVDAGETGETLTRKTVVKWKTEGFNLGEVASGAVKGLILRFSTDSISDSKQGATGVFDFEFDALGVE